MKAADVIFEEPPLWFSVVMTSMSPTSACPLLRISVFPYFRVSVYPHGFAHRGALGGE